MSEIEGWTLDTVFTTHPFKNKDALKEVCQRLNLSPAGTTNELRKKILTHVKNGKANEDTVRQIAL